MGTENRNEHGSDIEVLDGPWHLGEQRAFGQAAACGVSAHEHESDVCAVILAGGSGTRLWPLSREQYPKQLIGLLKTESLLQQTVRHVEGLETNYPCAERMLVVCAEAQRFITAHQLREVGAAAQIVLEPARRDTAAALTAAALMLTREGRDSIMVVMPADHAVDDSTAFRRALSAATHYADQGNIATLGVVPTHAETAYGYLKIGAPLSAFGGYKLDGFVEKPGIELAQRYVSSGTHWWNSGIYVVRATTWLAAIGELQPAIFAACRQAVEGSKMDGEFCRLDPDAFAASPADSIDYAVMERIGNLRNEVATVVIPLDAGWSDVGSWDAVANALPKDEAGNGTRGQVMLERASSTFVHAEGRLVACVGTRDLVVVETADAVLVVAKDAVQHVKGLVSQLKARQCPEADAPRKVHRPWGTYESVDHGERYQVKRIVVQPGASLSLQMHHHRAEHWIVVRGTALVTRGEETFLLSENESTYIPLGVKHRLENPGKLPLELIEIQSGSYLGEDDIQRFEDHYGRA
ncbi:mannose-1-phosphate guanylyltransferase/mannose-6-phosphate isomerase [Paraburkholderia sp. GAS41]|jgi:mannose-1-phosphate guanylyltransferase/mannose-6-phosphate isomerase|uniref:mannose-1-phosphate guanylyltransferase/mannose-6-phosphate isomerase n=1 Tax=Paraburkholderia sp. GAS41 TaxID=3035134 RepID=UPI003D195D02